MLQAVANAPKNLLRTRLLVWASGALLTLAIASYFLARISHLNQTIAAIEGEEAVWKGEATVVPPEILSWINLSLIAIPLCLALYLTSLLWYFLRGRNNSITAGPVATVTNKP